MTARTTTIVADRHTIDVFYLMTRAEADLNARRHLCGPVAPGVERKWLESARRADERGDRVGSKESIHRAGIWGDIANRWWPGACASLVAALPELDAFFVIPSSRPIRRDPLVVALRARFPSAIELVYSRADGVRFGDAPEDTIFHALGRQGRQRSRSVRASRSLTIGLAAARRSEHPRVARSPTTREASDRSTPPFLASPPCRSRSGNAGDHTPTATRSAHRSSARAPARTPGARRQHVSATPR